ncbi:MAG: hypothetical protein WBQ69_09800 [Gallionella sp.]
MLVILLIIIVGAAAFLLHTLNSYALQTARNKVTADALAKAKDALIAYAVTYADTHPGSTYGYLPSPDNNGTQGLNGEGSSETVGNTNVSVIGRLPWRTLDLPPLRDGNGECLWYAVSGTYKISPPPAYTLMNWDNYGLFQIYAAPGVPLTGATQDTYAVAAVFSPGVPLSGQNRKPDVNNSAPVCGGNYTASNYLDSDSSIPANNAAPSSTANAISTFYNAGASSKINDQIIYISSSDIFNAVMKRSDFGAFVSSMLNNAQTNLQNAGSLPTPVYITFSNTAAPSDSTSFTSTASGNIYHGKIPSNMLSSQYQNWQDNIQYGKCTFANCLTLNGAGNNCDGIIIFTGERIAASQTRTVANKNNQNNYLESPVLSPFSFLNNSPNNNFSGLTSYSAASPSADILKCIP